MRLRAHRPERRAIRSFVVQHTHTHTHTHTLRQWNQTKRAFRNAAPSMELASASYYWQSGLVELFQVCAENSSLHQNVQLITWPARATAIRQLSA